MLFNGDCLEVMKTLDDKSIDLVFCDLPYGQTSCKWDCKIDLEEFWKQIMRIKKLNTPLFFTTTTKFGVELIQSAPKKCFFRYDLVWVKSAPAGFLSAKKMPMRKHEMVYVFYEKLPLYDLSRHTHKFIKKEEVVKKVERDSTYGKIETHDLKTGKNNGVARYDPPLPVLVVKEDAPLYDKRAIMGKDWKNKTGGAKVYDPPLPTSVVKEGQMVKDFTPNKNGNLYDCPDNQEFAGRNGAPRYDPPLPTSVVKEEEKNSNKNSELYGKLKDNGYYHKRKKGETTAYEPPLPVSVVSVSPQGKASLAVKEDITITELEPEPEPEPKPNRQNARNGAKQAEGDYDCYQDPKLVRGMDYAKSVGEEGIRKYDPPLPNTLLEIKSTRGKHSTEKPVALMEWILSYYSKEGDIILDPTMGSGSTGVACKNLNRKFIGIELDQEIFEVAKSRNPHELVSVATTPLLCVGD